MNLQCEICLNLHTSYPMTLFFFNRKLKIRACKLTIVNDGVPFGTQYWNLFDGNISDFKCEIK